MKRNRVVVALLVGALVCFGAAARGAWRMHRLSDAVAFRLPVDFSTEGIYRATVRESDAGGCRRILRVRVTPGVNAGAELNDAMKGLEGEIVGADQAGREFYRQELWWNGAGWGRYGMLSDEMYPRGDGKYVITVTVRKPAAGMAGKRQEVVGEYDFCEIESMPIFLYAAAGFGFALFAVIVWLSRVLAKRRANVQP